MIECIQELYFQRRSLEMCHEYKIEQDDNCELEGEQTYFNLQLSVTSTTLLSIDPLLSTTTVTIDDNRERECCKRLYNTAEL